MSENKVYTAIGLMSGTSLDGIDVALIRTDGMDYTELLDFQEFPYDDSLQKPVRKAFGKTAPDSITAEAERLITNKHIEAVNKTGWRADIVGFHGQTIHHDPSRKFTWQIGDAQRLADETGIDVVGDMRQADVRAGGQGAPLLPLCHRAFAMAVEKPIVILNLGGVGNITWLGEDRADILAFDTGPANALIDDLVKERTGKPYDNNGQIAAKGKPNNEIIIKWLAHDYFNKQPPKSLDRNEWDVREINDLNLENAVATLAEFTVRSVVTSVLKLPGHPRGLYVAGGGRYNKYMMARLQEMLGFPVSSVENLGWNGDALEAQGFAYLAVRSLLGLALTLPTTTGVPEPMTGGVLYKASANLARRPA